MKIDIGFSALRASQFALSNVAQNLANANTEGYHRKLLTFQARPAQRFDQFNIGTGVDVRSVDRARSQIVESAYTTTISDLQQIEQQLSVEKRIESLFLPGPGSLQNQLNGFFDELASLSAYPNEAVQRNAVIQQGSSLAQQLRTTSDRLVETKTNIASQIEIEVGELNGMFAELIELQQRIQSENANSTSNDLLDRRDQLVNEIAKIVDIERNESFQNGAGLTIAGNSISIGLVPPRFEAEMGDDGTIEFRWEGTDKEVRFQSGSLAALQQLHNQEIGNYQERLDELTSTLIQQVDQAHAKGVGTDGPFSLLRSTRQVTDPDVPLNEANLPFPINAGELSFSVTDNAGERQTYSIAVDPTTDSLQDVADRISALGVVRATISPQTNGLSIYASAGNRFDFSGNLETIPDRSAFTGTSIPRFSGNYSDGSNQSLRVEIIGSGTVGLTPGLKAQVFDSGGTLVKELDIGDTYEADSGLEVITGVKLSFSAGNVNAGDELNTRLIADSDSTGLLAALGLNSFFSGAAASDIEVSSRVLANPEQLAVSKSGDNGDTFNLSSLITIRDALVLNDESLSLSDYLGEVVTEIGFQVQASTNVYQSISNLNSDYQSQIATISGVDLNEEMLNLAKFQKAYEASTRVIRTMEAMLDELYQIIR